MCDKSVAQAQPATERRTESFILCATPSKEQAFSGWWCDETEMPFPE